MTNHENSFEAPGRLTEMARVLEFDQISTEQTKFVSLGPDILARNERVSNEYGETTRLLEIIDDNIVALKGSGRSLELHFPMGTIVMNTLFSSPDGLLERRMLRSFSRHAEDVDTINRALDARERERVIVTKRLVGSQLLHYGWADDLMIQDRRANPEPKTELPALPAAEPASTNLTNQDIIDDLTERHAKLVEQAREHIKTLMDESLDGESRPPDEPVTSESKTATETIDISKVVPKFLFPEELKTSSPKRFALIGNVAELNQRTNWQLDAINKIRPPVDRIKPNYVTIVDDTHALFNGEDYDYGPFARSVLNQLLANYLSPVMVPVKSLGIPADNKSVFDKANAPRKVELFIEELKTRGMVYVSRYKFGDSVTLRPTIIRELRGGPQTPAGQVDNQHPDIITN